MTTRVRAPTADLVWLVIVGFVAQVIGGFFLSAAGGDAAVVLGGYFFLAVGGASALVGVIGLGVFYGLRAHDRVV